MLSTYGGLQGRVCVDSHRTPFYLQCSLEPDNLKGEEEEETRRTCLFYSWSTCRTEHTIV